MTWEQIQKAALDKIFSRLNYGTETALTSPDGRLCTGDAARGVVRND